VIAGGGTGEVRTGGAAVFVGGAGATGPVTMHAMETAASRIKLIQRIDLMMVTFP
jgi:hypothetical protein